MEKFFAKLEHFLKSDRALMIFDSGTFAQIDEMIDLYHYVGCVCCALELNFLQNDGTITEEQFCEVLAIEEQFLLSIREASQTIRYLNGKTFYTSVAIAIATYRNPIENRINRALQYFEASKKLSLIRH